MPPETGQINRHRQDTPRPIAAKKRDISELKIYRTYCSKFGGSVADHDGFKPDATISI